MAMISLAKGKSSMKKVAVECPGCGNIDYVVDSILVLAAHKCTACGAPSGMVKVEEDRAPGSTRLQ
jgi:predicted nucleic-acid-binding Zn-ribbon protein